MNVSNSLDQDQVRHIDLVGSNSFWLELFAKVINRWQSCYFQCGNAHVVLGSQKNHLIETVLLSTNNICFGLEIRLFKK